VRKESDGARFDALAGGAPAGVLGSLNELCAVKRARPSVAESYTSIKAV
jgi:hypothetical protein